MCTYVTVREVLSQTAAANQRLTADGWLASDPEPRGSDVTNGALSCSGSRKIYNAVCVHVYGESASGGRARFTKPTVVSWVYTLWYMSISVTQLLQNRTDYWYGFHGITRQQYSVCWWSWPDETGFRIIYIIVWSFEHIHINLATKVSTEKSEAIFFAQSIA